MQSAVRKRLRLFGGSELSFLTVGDASKPAMLGFIGVLNGHSELQ